MASIFLSYAREDARSAERIAKTLEDGGHSVWWDRELHAGERFSAEIDRALKGADSVVVLWSGASVSSAWVQDEAAVGRDSNRLVPILIEAVEPPLGFRQYHAVDLTRGLRSARSKRALTEAVAARAKGEPLPRPQVQRSRLPLHWRWAALAAVGLLVIAVSLWLIRSRNAVPNHSVVIAANGGDMARSAELARTVALDLGRYRAGSLGSLAIIPATDPRAKQAEYRVDLGVSGSGNQWQTDLSLRTRRSTGLLWTSSVAGEGTTLVDIRQAAASAIAAVLNCVGELQASKAQLSQEALSLYLNGCGKLSDYNTDDPGAELFGLFRQLTQKAPRFAQGWATLALLEAQSFPSVPQQDWHALAVSARSHVAQAKQINPDLPVVFAADAFLPENYLAAGRALAIVERGLSKFPENPLLHDARAHFLSRLGRTNESISEAKAALELNPLSPTAHDTYASALAYAGRTQSAFEALRNAETMWPGSTVLEQARYRLDLRYGDPRNALRLLERRGSGDARPIPMDDAWRLFLEARIDPSPAKVEAAIKAFRTRARGRGDWGYYQALGTFGRVDEAFQGLASDHVLDDLSASPDSFFRVHMRSIYSDPRFIGVAQRLEMLAYWKKSGVWPDFCREAKLPYDCKKEAAKYAS